MDRFVSPWRSALLLLLVWGCEEPGSSEEVPDPEPQVSVSQPAPEPGADRRARAEEAKKRLAALKKDLDPNATAAALMESATAAFQQQHWKEARTAFQHLVLLHPDHHPEAVHSAAQASFRLGEYNEGLRFFEDALELYRGKLTEARLLRVLGNVYLSVPHWGTKRGGVLARGKWNQGRHQDTHKQDRALAILRIEEARAIWEKVVANPAAYEADGSSPEALAKEQIEVLFDLTNALARFTPYDHGWAHWYYAWEQADDDDLADEEGPDQRVGRWGRSQLLYRAEPRGIPVDPEGRPVFEARPLVYGGSTTQKIKFLLHQIQALDPGTEKLLSAQALLRQALIFRARDGAERLHRLAGWWHNGKYPYKANVEEKELWELSDDEVYGLIATHLGVYRPPEDENALKLFQKVASTYPGTPSGDQAAYSVGLFYATRRQYHRAIKAYESYLAEFPKGQHREDAKARMRELRRPELKIDSGGVQLAGHHPRMSIEHRNITRVEGRVRHLDVEGLITHFQKLWKERKYKHELSLEGLGYFFQRDQKNFDRYARGPWTSFALDLSNDGTLRYQKTEVSIPISKEGLWVVEVKPPEGGASLALVMLESTAVVIKNTSAGELLWVVDADTGHPVANAEVEVFEYWNQWDQKLRKSIQHHAIQNAKTDRSGTSKIKVTGPRQRLITVRKGKRLAYAGDGYYWHYSTSVSLRPDVGLVLTDRPVYRPEHRVELRLWARRRDKGQYMPATAVKKLRLEIRDPKGQVVMDKTMDADASGGATFFYQLPKDAPLGLYGMAVKADGRRIQLGGHQFRVEEYKAPEFEVKVSVGDGPAKLGEKIPIEISAHYYFGGAVEGARVRYKVFRTDHDLTYAPPGPWDWLYGRGYGLCYYSYPWFDWWGEWGRRPWAWYPWWGPRPEPVRELVKEGEDILGHDGVLRVELDTKRIKKAFGDQDQKFIVKAEVRDASRRTITGQGEVLAARNQFFTSVDADRGYYLTGNTARITVRTLRPDQTPIEAEGTLSISRVKYTADNLDVIEEKPLVEVTGRTDATGLLEHRWDAAAEGQYRIAFTAKDAWGGEVVGSSIVWVWGPKFEGKRFKFNHLEVVSDQRTYRIGDTARLLVVSQVPGASILLATKADNGALISPQVVKLKGHTLVTEVPIQAEHVPNFFVEAVMVGAGKISEEVREVFVPPENAEMKVELRPLAEKNRPSTEGMVEVLTTALDGKPVSANVAVSVFDSSVLYIQQPFTPDIREHFWGQRRRHHPRSRTNLRRQLQFASYLSRPDRAAGHVLGGMANSPGFTLDAAKGDAAGVTRLATPSAPVAAQEAPARSLAAGKKSKSRRLREEDKRNGPADESGRDDNGAASVKRPDVRRNFADTAAWRVVTTDRSGRAQVRWKFPDNLTTWQVKAVGIGKGTRVGQSSTTVMTTKDLLVRLQAPRFFRERDRVMLSANVHNRLKSKKSVRVELKVTEQLLKIDGKHSAEVEVEAGGEVRIDWWVDVQGEGEATVRVSALTDQESDAKELRFPVLVHGLHKTVSSVGSMSIDQGPEAELKLTVPEARRPEETELVVRWAPTLAGAMLDALPFLLDYPYGCTEQTISRFVPAVLTKKALQLAGGFKLEDLKNMTRSGNPQQLNESKAAYEARLARIHQRFQTNPVYEQSVMEDMIRSGLARLKKMQRSDGGWGWWGADRSSVYTTAYVLWGLHEAQNADVPVPEEMVRRGRSALASLIPGHLSRYEKHQWVSDTDAFFAYVMSLDGKKNEKLNRYLFERRAKLTVYGKSLLALALWNLEKKDQANLVLRNAAQFLKEDPENQTAWIETSNRGWWYWYNSDIESNAFFLRALATIRPKDQRASKIVKWLLNNRQNGWYWRSTRDTAIVIASFAHYMRTQRFDKTDYDLEILLDGKVLKKVHIDARNLLTFDGELRLAGAELTGGEHTLTLRRKGVGAVFFNAYLSYFTLEEDVKPAGLELKVHRQYYRLTRQDRKHRVHDQRGHATGMKELAYRKVPIASGDQVKSGDLILVELMLESKNDYTFLAFEDPKPAGAEPVALKSGTTYGEAVANMELRDDRVVFFLRRMNQGKMKLEYRLRAEIPGTFHTMPTRGFGMYAPELRANSGELRFSITDSE